MTRVIRNMAYEQEMGMKEMKAPGVYIVEYPASPVSAQSVPTSVPVFIGYTPRAEDFPGHDCVNQAIRITSYDEFAAMFLQENACGFPTQFAVLPRSDVTGKTPELVLNGESFAVTPDPDTVYYMVASVRMFFQNGGSTAYIISLGNYGPASGKYQQQADLPVVNNNVNKDAYLRAIASLDHEHEPAICVMPDAVLLGSEAYAEVMNAALTMAERTNRFVCLLDIACGLSPDPADHISEVENFRNNLPNSSGYREALSFGVSYFPYLCTTQAANFAPDFRHIFAGDLKALAKFLEPDILCKAPMKEVLELPASADRVFNPAEIHQFLLSNSDHYRRLIQAVAERANVLPPSGAMAGIYAKTDQEAGVWAAPANVTVEGVSNLCVAINDVQQSYYLGTAEGKSVNVIRLFPALGVRVWGARTLDNSADGSQYISVKRTLIMLEQTILLAARQYVFEPNNAQTWAALKSDVTALLTNIWSAGGIIGNRPEDAFQVDIDLGTTMSATDITEGNMNLQVKLALIRPGEFFIISVRQEMQVC